MTRIPDREAQAKAEMAATQAGPAAARLLVAAFLAVLLSGSALEWLAPLPFDAGYRATQLHAHGPAAWLELAGREGPRAANRELRALLRRLDRWSEQDLGVVRRLRRPTQTLLLERLRFGNSQVRAGDGGWLFYEREVDSITGPPFLHRPAAERARLGDPESALRRFGADLRARGIALALVPAPAKSSIEAARLLGPRAPERPLRNPSYDELARRLEADGIVVFDPTPALFAAARRGELIYLRTDSHWRPETVDRVAAAMAEEIFRRGVLPRPRTNPFHRVPRRVVGHPDLVRLLGLPLEGEGPLYEPLVIQTVRKEKGGLFRPAGAADAPILLLGDSLAGTYGWGGQELGSGAGLAEQLAFHLQTPVQALLEPAGTGIDARQRLAAALAENPGALAGKRLVILEFAERELAIGPWNPAPLPAATPR